MKTKKKGRKTVMIIVGVILALIAGFALFLCIGLNLKDVSIKNVDISRIPDGKYTGELTGSRFGNKLSVSIRGGKIVDIQINKDMAVVLKGVSSQVFNEVIEKQSLQVDCVSGATVTSKAYLKSIEDALTK